MARDQRRLAAVVSADVAGYSRLMGRDDSDTLARLGAHRRDLIDPKIAEFGGRVVKTTGDGLLLEFPSVVDAVRCAVDVQRGMAKRNAGLTADQRMEFRVGVDVGDIIIEGDDIYGDGVNVAARLQELAEPGGICVSDRVHDDVYGKLNATFEDAGKQQLKNIVRPVHVHRMSLTEKHNPWCLRVSVLPSFAARWLLPRIGRFVAAHPDIDLDVRATPTLADFARNDADVAIRIGGGNWAGVTAELLFDEFYTPVCSPHLKGARLLSAPADLAGYTLLSSINEPWKPWFEAAGLDWPEPVRGFVFSDHAHMVQAAADGQGVAMARLSLLGSDIRNGVLVRPFSIVAPAAFRTYLVYPPHVAGTPKVSSFRGWLRDEIAAEQLPPR
jgi:class 3 adenylate cyclase/DNA-binding transcriptional LysR family regulator